MTLRDLALLLQHFKKWVIAVPLVCALVLAGAMVVREALGGQQYAASSALTVTDTTGLVNSASLSNLLNVHAQEQAATVSDGGVQATAKVDASTQSVSYTVSAPTEEEAVALANLLAESTEASLKEELEQHADAYLGLVDSDEAAASQDGAAYISSGTTAAERAASLRTCIYTVSPAFEATKSSSLSIVKYGAVGLVGGLFLIVCVLALYDALRRPIKGEEDVAAAQLPVLSEGCSAFAGEKLWTGICFSAERPLRSVCLVPLSPGDYESLSSSLAVAVENSGISVTAESADAWHSNAASESMGVLDLVDCGPINQSMAGVRAAHDAGATVLVVRRWHDSLADLVNALQELELGKARVVGVALL
ncbi:MAG: hypothetical protein UCH28_07635 [Adlercreutzia sp.]|nr:hypothetical protein [Adlercreutzia sp.]